MNYANEARKLADYIVELSFHQENPSGNKAYTHIAALYTNIVLQSGLNYKTVVQPRVERVASNYPKAYCVSGFQKAIEEEGLEHIILWKHTEKLSRMQNVIGFSVQNSIDTCDDLAYYLQHESNQENFLKIRGFGPKTLDYTLKLLNFDTIAVDRHIFSFIELAGLKVVDYKTTKNIVEFAADLMQVSRASIDYSIWTYMSSKNNAANKSTKAGVAEVTKAPLDAVESFVPTN